MEPYHGELHHVGSCPLYRHVRGHTFGGRAELRHAAVDVRDWAAAAEERFDVTQRVRLRFGLIEPGLDPFVCVKIRGDEFFRVREWDAGGLRQADGSLAVDDAEVDR